MDGIVNALINGLLDVPVCSANLDYFSDFPPIFELVSSVVMRSGDVRCIIAEAKTLEISFFVEVVDGLECNLVRD